MLVKFLKPGRILHRKRLFIDRKKFNFFDYLIDYTLSIIRPEFFFYFLFNGNFSKNVGSRGGDKNLKKKFQICRVETLKKKIKKPKKKFFL